METDQTQDLTNPLLNTTQPDHDESKVIAFSLPQYPKQENTFGLPTRLYGREPETFYCTDCQEVQISDINKKCTFGSACKATCLAIATIPCAIIGRRNVPDSDFYAIIHLCPRCEKEVGRG